jgi:transcriptional regulator with XRE-family HTH domain
MISLYEMGRQRPQLDTLERLRGALGVGVQELGRRLESRRFGGPEAASPWPLRGTAGREPPTPRKSGGGDTAMEAAPPPRGSIRASDRK